MSCIVVILDWERLDGGNGKRSKKGAEGIESANYNNFENMGGGKWN